MRASAARSTWCGGICERSGDRGGFLPGGSQVAVPSPRVPLGAGNRGTSGRAPRRAPRRPCARGMGRSSPPLPFFFPFFSPFPRLDSGGAKATDRVEVEELTGLVRVRNGPSILSSLRVRRSLIRFKLLPPSPVQFARAPANPPHRACRARAARGRGRQAARDMEPAGSSGPLSFSLSGGGAVWIVFSRLGWVWVGLVR